MIDECAAWADVGKARTAVDFLDQRSESPLESVSRAIIHERDLPPPETQITVRYSPAISYRLDFYWRAQRVIGEADGMDKYQAPEVLRAEKIRQENLERLGYKVVRWTWHEIVVDTGATMARLAAALGC
jgi:very-short-patch-repair endonuclease